MSLGYTFTLNQTYTMRHSQSDYTSIGFFIVTFSRDIKQPERQQLIIDGDSDDDGDDGVDGYSGGDEGDGDEGDGDGDNGSAMASAAWALYSTPQEISSSRPSGPL